MFVPRPVWLADGEDNAVVAVDHRASATRKFPTRYDESVRIGATPVESCVIDHDDARRLTGLARHFSA